MRKIIIIQCEGTKTQKSWRWPDKEVIFVADREEYERSHSASGLTPFQPDDTIPGTNDMTWRRAFLNYYRDREKPVVLRDSDDLCEAWQLYKHEVYRDIVEDENFGKGNLFILSAGWGLVNADYRLPPYDITFNPPKEKPYARTSFKRLWQQLQVLQYNPLVNLANQDITIHFFGTKKYRRLLSRYADPTSASKVIFHRSNESPAPKDNYVFVDIDDKLKALNINISLIDRKWPYKCAQLFIEGKL